MRLLHAAPNLFHHLPSRGSILSIQADACLNQPRYGHWAQLGGQQMCLAAPPDVLPDHKGLQQHAQGKHICRREGRGRGLGRRAKGGGRRVQLAHTTCRHIQPHKMNCAMLPPRTCWRAALLVQQQLRRGICVGAAVCTGNPTRAKERAGSGSALSLADEAAAAAAAAAKAAKAEAAAAAAAARHIRPSPPTHPPMRRVPSLIIRAMPTSVSLAQSPLAVSSTFCTRGGTKQGSGLTCKAGQRRVGQGGAGWGTGGRWPLGLRPCPLGLRPTTIE